jgi:23S rRNA (cytosine1962-C5)-methyltransferase
MESVILKKGREKILYQRHHWIFSGAIASFPTEYQDGDLVAIYSSVGELLGWGFFNKGCSLAGRVVSFGREEPYVGLTRSLFRALHLRQPLLDNPQTTSCRLVNGEGDALPGLIVDKYGPYLVVQCGTLGMRKLLPFLLDRLRESIPIKGIYDKSNNQSLKEEGIAGEEATLWGEVPEYVEIKEEGIRYSVDLKKGQKTGFFLDQREMRKMISTLSYGKRVLNGFCYTGGFTLAALQGGASHVDSVDISSSALDLCQKNVALNGFSPSQNRFYQEDLFDFLSTSDCNYELVILDPPAFAKKKRDIPTAIKGYKRIFGLAMKKMPPQSLLLISSCSYYIFEDLFEKIVIETALEAKRAAHIIGRHRHAFDHPVNLFHPESNYLKSLLIVL